MQFPTPLSGITVVPQTDQMLVNHIKGTVGTKDITDQWDNVL